MRIFSRQASSGRCECLSSHHPRYITCLYAGSWIIRGWKQTSLTAAAVQINEDAAEQFTVPAVTVSYDLSMYFLL